MNRIAMLARGRNMLEGRWFLDGGSGFLGRSFLRRAAKEKWPASFTVYSRDEEKQWQLKRKYPDTVCVLGDIARDIDRLMAAMAGHDGVIHMSAVKFIPEAEWNVFETIDVNINGSRNVALAAKAAGVKTVVGVSTDKSVAPLNLYGMTKAVMERMFSEANRLGATKFVTVRYGNVIGSTGSVIPVFRQQIEDHKQLKVTDSRMTRFWLGVDQAIDLILWAVKDAEAYPGNVFIPWCPAMKIVDIAKAVWRMEVGASEPDIVYTGLRPGEKLHEYLFNEQEAPRMEMCGKLGFRLRPATEPGKQPEMWDYTSEHPNQWVSHDQMISLIEDAKTI